MSILSGEMSGMRSLSIGSMTEAVCSEESESVDIQKITAIQRTTGSQYLKYGAEARVISGSHTKSHRFRKDLRSHCLDAAAMRNCLGSLLTTMICRRDMARFLRSINYLAACVYL